MGSGGVVAIESVREAEGHWPCGRFKVPADPLYGGACCSLVLICVLIARPFADAAFVDDWAYAHMAMKLAQTGHFQYNDWVTSTLLFQSVWGALWIGIFGFSFDLLRIATLPFSLGSVYLAYAMGRRLGLAPALASLGALTFGTSPLFLPHAATFMTEPYTCFFTLACVYAFVRIVQAETLSQATQWLTVLSTAILLGCSNRQIMCVAPASLIPCSMWARRKDRAFFWRAAFAGAVCIGEIALLSHFFARPYAPLKLPHAQLMRLVKRNAPEAARMMISLLLCGLTVSLPALACFLARWRPAKIAFLFLVSLIAGMAAFFLIGADLIAPYLGETLTVCGIWYGEILGTKPVILSVPARLAVTWLFFAFSLGFAGEIMRNPRSGSRSIVPSAVALYSLLYIALLVPGALVLFEFDRYILPLVPLWIILILLKFRLSNLRVPIAAWAFLSVFGVYAVATTHDYFASLRARALVAKQTERLGIRPDHIAAGFELDGWTQLSLTNQVIGTRYEDHLVDDSAKGVWYAFWDHAPSLIPDYIAVSSDKPAPGSPGLPRVTVRTWLPPAGYTIAIYKRKELTDMVRAFAVAGAVR